MKLKHKLVVVFAVFVTGVIVFGIWAFIAFNLTQYAAPPPSPLPTNVNYTGEKNGGVTVSPLPQEELESSSSLDN